MFVLDVVTNHLNTSDLHADSTTTTFHIPAMFGDDFAYTNATHNFLFIDKLAALLSQHSLDRFGVSITLKYSTVDEYWTALTISTPKAEYPVYQGDFLPYL